jgi:hypothetical protein
MLLIHGGMLPLHGCAAMGSFKLPNRCICAALNMVAECRLEYGGGIRVLSRLLSMLCHRDLDPMSRVADSENPMSLIPNISRFPRESYS